jgi:hypothetical protein
MNKQDIAVLLTEISVTDKRKIGRPDVEAWSAVLTDDIPLGFARQAAVAHFREKPDTWLNAGHIVERWRAYRRDQLAREEDAMREARQAALDAKNVEALGVTALAEAITSEPVPVKYFRRSQSGQPNPLTVPCPWCRVMAGHACRFPNTTEYTKNPHPSRVDAATALHNEKQEA